MKTASRTPETSRPKTSRPIATASSHHSVDWLSGSAPSVTSGKITATDPFTADLGTLTPGQPITATWSTVLRPAIPADDERLAVPAAAHEEHRKQPGEGERRDVDEPGVVARAGVLAAGVAEADDEQVARRPATWLIALLAGLFKRNRRKLAQGQHLRLAIEVK